MNTMQIEIEGYTRTGFRVVIKQNTNNRDSVKDLLNLPDQLNLLPVKPEKPDETEYTMISHVALTEKDDGTLHMAYYHPNEALETRYTHKYFDKPSDVDDFTAWSGINIGDLPTMPGNQHPKRGTNAAKTYLVALPESRALIRKTTYIQKDDVWEASHSVERYINSSTSSNSSGNSPAKPDNSTEEPDLITLSTWQFSDEEKASLQAYLVEEGLTEQDAIALTGVKDWTGFPSPTTALNIIRQKRDTANRQPQFRNRHPGNGTGGFKQHRQRQQDSSASDDTDKKHDAKGKQPELDEINF